MTARSLARSLARFSGGSGGVLCILLRLLPVTAAVGPREEPLKVASDGNAEVIIFCCDASGAGAGAGAFLDPGDTEILS